MYLLHVPFFSNRTWLFQTSILPLGLWAQTGGGSKQQDYVPFVALAAPGQQWLVSLDLPRVCGQFGLKSEKKKKKTIRLLSFKGEPLKTRSPPILRNTLTHRARGDELSTNTWALKPPRFGSMATRWNARELSWLNRSGCLGLVSKSGPLISFETPKARYHQKQLHPCCQSKTGEEDLASVLKRVGPPKKSCSW